MRTNWYRKLLALLLVISGSPALAAGDGQVDQATIEMNRKANEACYACHSAAGMSLSGILCVRHNMYERSMYAEQQEDESRASS